MPKHLANVQLKCQISHSGLGRNSSSPVTQTKECTAADFCGSNTDLKKKGYEKSEEIHRSSANASSYMHLADVESAQMQRQMQIMVRI